MKREKTKIELEYQNLEDNAPIRLNKFLSESGVCSRREADRLIEAGKVWVDGERAKCGMKVLPKQEVRVGQKKVKNKPDMVILAVNKPAGIVCTEERRERNSIIRFLDYPTRITYIGRLDKDSEGLLLMTNNGDIINRIMRASNFHEKEYIVKVKEAITEDFLEQMRNGVEILGTITRKCQVEQIGKYTFRIILTQGLNRQIRRMCEALEYEVKSLRRVRIMNIELGDLKEGKYRRLTNTELDELYSGIQNSSNTGVWEKGTMNGRQK